MKLALKLHGVAMIALIMSLTAGIDLSLAYLIGMGSSTPVVQIYGVEFNGAQLVFCILTLAMSFWKLGGALHIRDAAQQGHTGVAGTATILLACSVSVSAALQLSWLHGKLATETATELLQIGVNLSATIGGDPTLYAYLFVAIGITFLQFGAATLPVIVFGSSTIVTPSAPMPASAELLVPEPYKVVANAARNDQTVDAVVTRAAPSPAGIAPMALETQKVAGVLLMPSGFATLCRTGTPSEHSGVALPPAGAPRPSGICRTSSGLHRAMARYSRPTAQRQWRRAAQCEECAPSDGHDSRPRARARDPPPRQELMPE